MYTHSIICFERHFSMSHSSPCQVPHHMMVILRTSIASGMKTLPKNLESMREIYMIRGGTYQLFSWDFMMEYSWDISVYTLRCIANVDTGTSGKIIELTGSSQGGFSRPALMTGLDTSWLYMEMVSSPRQFQLEYTLW